MTDPELLSLLARVADTAIGATALALVVSMRGELRAVAARVGVVERRHSRGRKLRAVTEPGA